jgi:hypothetical protein
MQGSSTSLSMRSYATGFAAALGAHSLCPALLALFHGHLFGSHCPNLTKLVLASEIWITAARAGCESCTSPEGRIGAHCFASFKGDRREQIHAFFRNVAAALCVPTTFADAQRLADPPPLL